MLQIEFLTIGLMLVSLGFAYWCGQEIILFPKRINLQIYQDFQSLVESSYSLEIFQVKSKLQPKITKWHRLFYLLFPLIIYFNHSFVVSVVLIILCFLSLLDYCYYLTDIRYVAIIFIVSLLSDDFNQNALFITILFFLSIHTISHFLFKKEGFGLGDSLVLIAISSLFSEQEILMLVLLASLLGILFYLLYWGIKKQKLEKLPFIPFITLSTFIVILARI